LFTAVCFCAAEGSDDDRTKLITSVAPVSARSAVRPAPEPFGRITGTVFCRSTEPLLGVLWPNASLTASKLKTRRARLPELNPGVPPGLPSKRKSAPYCKVSEPTPTMSHGAAWPSACAGIAGTTMTAATTSAPIPALTSFFIP
jgi:hypothetical protein